MVVRLSPSPRGRRPHRAGHAKRGVVVGSPTFAVTSCQTISLTSTAIDRSRWRDDTPVVPVLFDVGSAERGPPGADERFIVFDRAVAIGRRALEMADADAHWVVKDELVSRVHCCIRTVDDAWTIQDFSAAGTEPPSMGGGDVQRPAAGARFRGNVARGRSVTVRLLDALAGSPLSAARTSGLDTIGLVAACVLVEGRRTREVTGGDPRTWPYVAGEVELLVDAADLEPRL